MGRAHLNLTPWQAIGYALQWWDNRKTLDKYAAYTASVRQVAMAPLYCVSIQAPWGAVFDFHVQVETGRWSIFNPEQYHYRTGVLGLYKRQDLRTLFLWAQRIMEHSPTI